MAVTHPRKAVQVQLLPDALTARSSIGSRTPAPQAGRMGSTPIRAIANWPSGGTGRHATLRTSCLNGRGSSTLPLVTDLLIAGAGAGAQLAPIRPVRPVRYRGLQLAGGHRLNRASYAWNAGCNSRSAPDVSGQAPVTWASPGNLVDNVVRPWPFGRPPWLGVTLMKCVIHRQDSYPDNVGHWQRSVALEVLLAKVSA